MSFVSIFLCGLLIAVSSAVAIPLEFSVDESVGSMTLFRLPNDTVPISYKLFLVPLMNGTLLQRTGPATVDNIPAPGRFFGTVEITITVLEVTKRITLHAVDLDVTEVAVFKESGVSQTITSVDYSSQDQLLFVNLQNELVLSNVYMIRIKYYGTHNNRMKGFYQSVYPHTDGLRVIAATQFESTFARWAFPCYDEPKYRTPFDISIAVKDNSLAVISNTPLKESRQDSQYGYIKTFETTPAMATYLVAFIVGKFAGIDTKDRITVWTRENVADSAKYIADKAPRILKSLEGITGIPYSLKKLDIAAIPDFSAGAMENWGLTTYRESRALVNELSTTRQKLLATTVPCHEFAHQWFGDLVTPIWWTWTWLNEAFATYYEYKITSMIEPTWRLLDLFVIEELQSALRVDGDSVDRPMTYYVNSPQEIDNQFDVIIYNKGGSILRMLQHAVGQPTFNKAITWYLKRGSERSGGSVTSANLIDAFEDAVAVDKSLPTGISIMKVIKSWTEQESYPLVSVTRDYAKKTILVTQSVYQHDGKPKQKKLLWQIPLTFTTKNKPNFEDTKPVAWLTEESYKDFLTVNSEDWVIFNLKQTGYYRVNYDEQNWNLLQKDFFSKHETIHPLSRAHIIDDLFHFAKDGLVSYKLPLSFASYLINERDIIPWYAAINAFKRVRIVTQGTMVQPALQALVSKLISPQYERFGMNEIDSENFISKMARSIIVSAACLFKHPKCVDDAKKLMNEWITTGGKKVILPDVLSAVFCTGIAYGTDKEWNAVKKYYEENGLNFALAETVLPALGCSDNVTQLQSLIETPFNRRLPYRAQNNRYIYDVISKTEGVDAAFNVISKWLPIITENNKYEINILLNIVASVGKYAQTEEHLKQLENIKNTEGFKKAPTDLKSAFDEAVNRVKINSARRTKQVALIKAQLLDDTTTTTSTQKPTTKQPHGAASTHIGSVPIVVFNICCVLFAFKYVISW